MEMEDMEQRLQREAEAFLDEINVPWDRRHAIDFSRALPQALDAAYGSVSTLLPREYNELLALLQAVSRTCQPQTSVDPALAAAFASEYIGDAHEQLYRHLDGCWVQYRLTRSRYDSPCFAILQSSGFGKTRLLRELAVMPATSAVDRAVVQRVLYVCMREDTRSTEYPPATPKLRGYLFPPIDESTSTPTLVTRLAEKLVAAFERLMISTHETPTQQQMMELFDGKDAPVVAFLKQKLVPTEPIAKAMTSTSTRVSRRLVLAVDEARMLLPRREEDGLGWLVILRRALDEANTTIARLYNNDSGVFAIVVDSDAKILGVPSNVEVFRGNDPCQRVPRTRPCLFPPFVLTTTIDVMRGHEPTRVKKSVQHTRRRLTPTQATALAESVQAYEDEVVEALRALPVRASWRRLRSLGRPLWLTRSDETMEGEARLVTFAAGKLLNGASPTPPTFSEKTMFGVAAMLCRLGVRPHASSSTALRLVADFMAVLSYVGYEQQQCFCSYSSDPVLTLGATWLWHSSRDALTTYMLPQLHKLLHAEALDTEAGELVARIVLLLAMDATRVLETGELTRRQLGAGEFYSVWTFLTALHGQEPHLKEVASDPETKNSIVITSEYDSAALETQAVLQAVKEQWCGWCLSFTHFVELSSLPSEDVLWAMLGRRVAGVFPQGKYAVDLMIPICTAGEDDSATRISMIVVRVETHAQRGDSFPKGATACMRPDSIFQTDKAEATPPRQKLADLRADDILSIYMSPREETPSRFYLCNTDTSREASSWVLYLEGLEAWSTRREPSERPSDCEDVAAGAAVDVVSKGVAAQLHRLLDPRTTTAGQEDEGADKEAAWGHRLVEMAAAPLAETLLQNVEFEDDDDEAMQIDSSTSECQAWT